jgi:hypothetical protein
MLKSKKTFGLLLLVVIIWGIVGYKIYSQLTDDAVMTIREVALPGSYSDSVDESMHLAFSYADPFLKNVTVKKVEFQRIIHKVTRPNKMPVIAKSAPVINWSLVKYYGLMSNASRAVKTGVVRFDEEDFFVREGDHVDIFTVLDVRKDSIKLGFDNSIRYIRKQN